MAKLKMKKKICFCFLYQRIAVRGNKIINYKQTHLPTNGERQKTINGYIAKINPTTVEFAPLFAA